MTRLEGMRKELWAAGALRDMKAKSAKRQRGSPKWLAASTLSRPKKKVVSAIP